MTVIYAEPWYIATVLRDLEPTRGRRRAIPVDQPFVHEVVDYRNHQIAASFHMQGQR
jgi:hypothetical protein